MTMLVTSQHISCTFLGCKSLFAVFLVLTIYRQDLLYSKEWNGWIGNEQDNWILIFTENYSIENFIFLSSQIEVTAFHPSSTSTVMTKSLPYWSIITSVDEHFNENVLLLMDDGKNTWKIVCVFFTLAPASLRWLTNCGIINLSGNINHNASMHFSVNCQNSAWIHFNKNSYELFFLRTRSPRQLTRFMVNYF